jgi:hypothetical protein
MSSFRTDGPRGPAPISSFNADPGPTTSSFDPGSIEDSNLRAKMPPAVGLAGGVPSGGPVPDPEIEALELAPIARAAAYALKRAHPTVKFTSGRRSKQDQARAMAGNVARNPHWIEQTYVLSPLRTKCQGWVNAHPDKTSPRDIEGGIFSVLATASDAELGRFSRHLAGMAFDIAPVNRDADQIKATIRQLPGLDKFLDSEGGLVRWHAQF